MCWFVLSPHTRKVAGLISLFPSHACMSSMSGFIPETLNSPGMWAWMLLCTLAQVLFLYFMYGCSVHWCAVSRCTFYLVYFLRFTVKHIVSVWNVSYKTAGLTVPVHSSMHMYMNCHTLDAIRYVSGSWGYFWHGENTSAAEGTAAGKFKAEK